MAVSTLVILGIVICVFQPITIIANLLTIVAFMKVRTLQNHTSNLLIFALSIADFVTGIYVLLHIGIPFAFSLRPPLGEIGCMMSVPLDNIYITSNLILVAISIDRVLLVSMDYSKYVKLITKFRLQSIIVTLFLFGQIPTVIDLSLWNYAKENNAKAASINFKELCHYPSRRMKSVGIYVYVCLFLFPLFLIGILSIIFVKRLLIRINTSRRIRPEPQNQENNRHAIVNQDEIPRAPASEEETTKKRYVKPAVTLAALVLAMSISMLPFCSYHIVESLTGLKNTKLTYATYLMLQLNPLLDPLFFAATQKGIREYYGAKIRAWSRAFAAFLNYN